MYEGQYPNYVRMQGALQTFVAINNWSRIPLFSAHSPTNSSELSSWLRVNERNQYGPHTLYNPGGCSLTVRGVNEIPSVVEIRVQKLEAAFLIHTTHAEFIPLVADAHSSELDG